MGLAVTGLVLNALSCLALAANADVGPWVALVGALFWLLQLLGTLLLRTDQLRDAGHLMVWIGALFFLPVGIIGPLGARRVVREREEARGLEANLVPA